MEINAAASRDDVALLLYIWTQSFREGKAGIITRKYISALVPQISVELEFSVDTFSDLVRVKLLRESPYHTPSDAFVEYYPSSRLEIPDGMLKSTNKAIRMRRSLEVSLSYV